MNEYHEQVVTEPEAPRPEAAREDGAALAGVPADAGDRRPDEVPA